MANFPTEMVNLPSKGKLYPKTSPLSKGEVELKYMTAKEEDILTSINLIRKGIVLDKLLEALIVDKSIKLDDMLVGDKNAILIAARILGYGKDYNLQVMCEECEERSPIKVDCTKFEDIEIDEKVTQNKFSIDLPTTKVKLEFKLLTSGEESDVMKEVEGLQKIQPDINFLNSYRYKKMILSVNGETQKSAINDFVDNQFLTRDTVVFKKYLNEITPDVDMTYECKCPKCGHSQEVDVPLGTGFFWPNAE